MTRLRAAWRARWAWPWTVADLAERAGWCWSDLCSWALDRPGASAGGRRLWQTRRRSTCARGQDVARLGVCYCGRVGPDSPSERRRRGARAHRRGLVDAATFAVSAVLIAAVVTAVVDAAAAGPASSGVVHVPCSLVEVDDRTGCTWQVDIPDGAPLVVLDSAPGDQPGAARRAELLADARGDIR